MQKFNSIPDFSTNLFQNRHCLLDVGVTAVERLKRIQIYPIVLLLRFKSSRQIKEIKDKMSEKAAKEMYEHALKLESDYRQYFTGNYQTILFSEEIIAF